MIDILNNSVSTLSLTISLRVTYSGKILGNTQADSQGPIESTIKLGTSVKDNDTRKALMLNHMLNKHVCPVNSIRFVSAGYCLHILGKLVHKL